MSEMNFQVNLQGMIELLSKHLYSSPGVFIRELLQNGVDAITARKRLGHRFDARVTVEIYGSRTIAVHDNGIGLSESEIQLFWLKSEVPPSVTKWIQQTTILDNLAWVCCPAS